MDIGSRCTARALSDGTRWPRPGNSNYYERVWVHPDVPSTSPPMYANGCEDDLYAIDGDGCVSAPEAPGLGVEDDWDLIMAHRTGGAEHAA